MDEATGAQLVAESLKAQVGPFFYPHVNFAAAFVSDVERKASVANTVSKFMRRV